MALDSYPALCTSILDWLGRPGDPLVSPAVPDFVALFEETARDVLRAQFGDLFDVALPPVVPGTFDLPNDFVQMKRVVYDGDQLEYLPNWDLAQLTDNGAVIGAPLWYTIKGTQLLLGPVPDTNLSAFIDYSQGLPPLSLLVPTNWLLAHYPSLYLFGSLAAAEAYIGDDERVGNWVQQRDIGFERVRRASVVAQVGGSPLQIRVDGPTP